MRSRAVANVADRWWAPGPARDPLCSRASWPGVSAELLLLLSAEEDRVLAGAPDSPIFGRGGPELCATPGAARPGGVAGGDRFSVAANVVSPVFIGRREELASLAGQLERARGKDPAFALIGGEAGVGKTRLARGPAMGAAGRDCCVLTGQCVELGGEGLPLAPLVDALRTLARAVPLDLLAEVLGPAAPAP